MTRLDRWIDNFIRRVRDNPRSKGVLIGPAAEPFMWRFFVIPRNRFFNIYLHRIFRSDVGELHDHRMASISVVLQGWYYEQQFVEQPIEGKPLPLVTWFIVERLHPLFRRARTPHRLVLEMDSDTGSPRPVWSLFIGFRHVRNWGWWTEHNGGAHWFPHEEMYE